MIILEHPDLSETFRCPICGTGKDQPVVKIPRDWDDIGPTLTLQVHVECLDLRVYPMLDRFVIKQELNLWNDDL